MVSNVIKKMSMALCIAALAACASVEPPDTLATQARESVEHAQSIGAEEQAPLVLREANQQLAKGEQAMQEDEHEEARRFFEKAVINSELAVARTNAERSRRAAQEINENLDALRNQSSTPSDTGSYSFE